MYAHSCCECFANIKSHVNIVKCLRIQDVVLPDDQKSLIKETVENFAAYKKVRKALAQDGSSGVHIMGDPEILESHFLTM